MFIKQYYPYGISFLIGFFMILLFVLGWRLDREFNTLWGTIFMQIGLLIWPFYIIIVFSLSLFVKDTEKQHILWLRLKQFRRASLIIPLGAIAGVMLTMFVAYLSGGSI